MAVSALYAKLHPSGLPQGYNYTPGGTANFSGLNVADLIRQYQQDQALPSYNGDGESGLDAMIARQNLNFGNGQAGPGSWGYNGYDVIPLANGGYGLAKGTPGAPNGTGWGTYGEQPMDVYDASGKFTGTGMTPKGLNPNDESGKQFAIGAMFMAPMALAAMGALGGAAGASGAGGAGAGSVGGAGGFIGEGAASGIPAWDSALAASPSWTAAGGLGGAASAAQSAGGGAGSAGGGAGVTGFGDAGTMYAGSDAASASTLGGGASVLGGQALPAAAAGGLSKWLGPASTALGALSGSQPQTQSQTQTNTIDPRMAPYIYDSLLPAAKGLLTQQGPMAAQNASQLQAAGSGLLGTSMTPDFGSNPYMTSVADDLQRRTQEMLGANNLSIQGNSVNSMGLGSSRQGVAQGLAAGKAADYLQGNLANLYQSQYNTDANRALQAKTLGAGLLGQAQQTQWQPLMSASNIYSNFSGLGGSKTTSEQTGGGTNGLLGGALSGAAFGHQMGWW